MPVGLEVVRAARDDEPVPRAKFRVRTISSASRAACRIELVDLLDAKAILDAAGRRTRA
jgi:hypothetical protein